MAHAGLPESFWAEALHVAVDARSMVSKQDKKISRTEALLKKNPSVSFYRIFGSLVFVRVTDRTRRKLDEKSTKAVLIRSVSHGKYTIYK